MKTRIMTAFSERRLPSLDQRHKLSVAFFVIFNALVLSVNAQTFPYWDSSPDFDTTPANPAPNKPVGAYNDGLGPCAGNGEDAYFIAGYSFNEIWEWNSYYGWMPLARISGGSVESSFAALTIKGHFLYVGGWFGGGLDQYGYSTGNLCYPDGAIVSATNVAKCDLTTGTWSGLGYVDNSSDGRYYVQAIAVDSLTNVYIGTHAEPVLGQWDSSDQELLYTNVLQKWDGTSWSEIGGQDWGLLTAGVGQAWAGVTALAADGTNIYVGGYLGGATNSDGSFVQSEGIIKWDGTRWHAMGGDPGHGILAGVFQYPEQSNPSGFVWGDEQYIHSIAVAGTNVFVSGRISWPSGGVARFSTISDATLPTDSLINGYDENGWPYSAGEGTSLTVQNGVLYVAGYFNTVGDTNTGSGLTVNGIASWDSRNTTAVGTWENLGSGLVDAFTGYAGWDYCYLAANTNAVFVTGAFDQAGSVSIPYFPPVARWMTAPDSAGTITTVAGDYDLGQSYSGDGGPATGAGLYFPQGTAIDASGNLYIADTWNGVLREDTNGVISTVAGNGSGYSGDGGAATDAGIDNPISIAIDASGNLYIAETGDVVRKVDINGVITTVAGNYSLAGGYSGDGGAATDAALNWPTSVCLDNQGNLYICDCLNCVIRKVDSTGVITTIAGNISLSGTYCGDGGPATSAGLYNPYTIALDASGNLYIADSGNNVIRKVDTSGTITTVAGNNSLGGGYSGDGGAATDATINWPIGVTADNYGNIYIADNNNVIRKVDTSGIITTVVGDYSLGGTYSGDGGPPLNAGLSDPTAVSIDMLGNLYISDTGNSVIRKVSY